ncbi:MAG: sodium:proton antiporter [Bacteroidota bacterium]
MTVTIIITICTLLLLAYIFDVTSPKTKIPSVILLLILGWLVKRAAVFFEFPTPDLSPALPILGTVGLILIVLEGSLELELNKSKLPLIAKSSVIALLPMLVIAFSLAYAFQVFGHVDFKPALVNAIPLAVISSAIAIPSARNLARSNKEFITYESSLSDIFGVIFFNFIALNDSIGSRSVGHFILELLIILLVSFVATLALAYFLDKIKHHIKFIPIILMIILIYTFSKIYHLPALIFILLFGLFIGNIDELKNFKFIRRFHPVDFNREVHKFQELTTELTFLIRSLFFLLFGFLIETEELMNADTIFWALGITAGIFVIRGVFLKLFRLSLNPLFYIAPRGLITILLFLSIPVTQQIDLADKSLIIQVIILSALLMMIGLMKHNGLKKDEESEEN